MAYTVPSFAQTRNLILQEIKNTTGISANDDSDAAIRAEGTASVVDGLYSHQLYIQKQLFIATADEPFLYIHAHDLGVPRLGGTYASGEVTAISNVELTIQSGTRLSDGKGHFWSVITTTLIAANTPSLVSVQAEQKGSSWNFNGSLFWINPQAGLSSTVNDASIGGGSDQEALEDWRFRLSERKQLGLSRDREADLKAVIKTITGIEHVYPYPKRRGLGSLDVAITAVGNPPTLPSQNLIDLAQNALDEYSGFWSDCRVYAPTEQLVNITAVVNGNVIIDDVKNVIRNYFSEIEPTQQYQAAILTARIVAVAGVTDVELTPSSNIIPTVNPFHTNWLRLGNLNVSTI